MKKSHYLMIITLVLLACNIRVRAADIALYSDRGASEDCVIATKHMFNWMGFEVELIDASHINSRSLDGFRLICFPGGNMYQYAQDIAESGKEKIREFIGDGGGYIGICGGAYFTGERVFWQSVQLPMSPLGIFPGATQGPIDAIAPYPDCVMCKIDIVEQNHPITQTESDSAWIMYCYGPVLLPDNSADVTILGRYGILDQPAMIVFEYGEGRVFIVGVHPELEEDSERDGVNFGDEYDDRGSDWDMMRKATLWCLGEGVE